MTVPTAPLLPVPRLVLDQRLQVFPGIEEVEPRLEDDVTHVHRARSGEVVRIQRDVVILRARIPIQVSAQVAAFCATTHAVTGVAGSGPPGGEHSGAGLMAMTSRQVAPSAMTSSPRATRAARVRRKRATDGSRPRRWRHNHHASPSIPASRTALQAPSVILARVTAPCSDSITKSVPGAHPIRMRPAVVQAHPLRTRTHERPPVGRRHVATGGSSHRKE
jgi:hypothetical protein